MLSDVMKELAHIDFTQYGADALGDAYEFLIGQFAAGSGKKAGEFYTPQAVSELITRIVTKDKEGDPDFSIYDKIIAELIQAHRARNTSKPYEIRGFEVFLHCIGETGIQVMDKDGDFGGFLLRGGCRTESAPFVRCRYLSKHRLQGVQNGHEGRN